MEDFKLLSSWPRRDVSILKEKDEMELFSFFHTHTHTSSFQLTTLDPTDTLEALKLFPQETLMLEEK